MLLKTASFHLFPLQDIQFSAEGPKDGPPTKKIRKMTKKFFETYFFAVNSIILYLNAIFTSKI